MIGSTLLNASRRSVESAYLEARAVRVAEAVNRATEREARANRVIEAAERGERRSRSRSRDREAPSAAEIPVRGTFLHAMASNVQRRHEADVTREIYLAQERTRSSHAAVLQYSVQSAVASFLLSVQSGVEVGSMFVRQYSVTVPWYYELQVVAYRTGVIKLAMQHDMMDGLRNTLLVQQFMMQPMSCAVEVEALNDLLKAAFCTDSVIMQVDVCRDVQVNFHSRSWMEWEQLNDVRYDTIGLCYYVSRESYDMPAVSPNLQRQNAMVEVEDQDAQYV